MSLHAAVPAQSRHRGTGHSDHPTRVASNGETAHEAGHFCFCRSRVLSTTSAHAAKWGDASVKPVVTGDVPLNIPEMPIETLDESYISRWSLEVWSQASDKSKLKPRPWNIEYKLIFWISEGLTPALYWFQWREFPGSSSQRSLHLDPIGKLKYELIYVFINIYIYIYILINTYISSYLSFPMGSKWRLLWLELPGNSLHWNQYNAGVKPSEIQNISLYSIFQGLGLSFDLSDACDHTSRDHLLM